MKSVIIVKIEEATQKDINLVSDILSKDANEGEFTMSFDKEDGYYVELSSYKVLWRTEDNELYDLYDNAKKVTINREAAYAKLEFVLDSTANYEEQAVGLGDTIPEKALVNIVKHWQENTKKSFNWRDATTLESKSYLLLFNAWNSGPDYEGEYDAGYDYLRFIDLSDL